jgi:hypothetical protein
MISHKGLQRKEAMTLSFALIWGINLGGLGIPLAEQIGTGSRVVEEKLLTGTLIGGIRG